jgi:integrase
MEKRTIKPIIFERAQLEEFVEFRKSQTSPRTHPSFKKNAERLWNFTKGSINQQNWKNLYDEMTNSYKHETQVKFFGFIKSFLHWLEVDHDIDPQWYVGKLQPLKDSTSKEPPAVLIQDIKNVLEMLDTVKFKEEGKGEIYKAMVLFQAYTGQRPEFITHLTVGQAKIAINNDTPVIKVESWQDKQGQKTGKSHLIAIHPNLIPILKKVAEGRDDDNEPLFGRNLYESINKVFQNHPVPNINNRDITFNLGHCRKFFEQESGRIGFKTLRRGEYCNYMMFHEIKGTKWDHYNRILSDELYKAYIDTWGKIKIEEGEQPENKLELKETTPEEQQYNVEKNRAWLEKFRPDELLISDGKEDMERWQYEESKADYKRMEEWSREYDRKHGKQ